MAPQTWGGRLFLEVGFRGRGGLLAHVRSLVSALCSEHIASPDVSEQLVAAAQELLENLVKYSEPGQGRFEFELQVDRGTPKAFLRTRSRALPARLAQAESVLRSVLAAPQPEALFAEWLQSSDSRPYSQLGLVRLRAESGLALEYQIAGDELVLSASRAVPPRETP